MSEQDDHTGALIHAYLENARMEERADYLRRGRHQVGAATEALKALWTDAFKRWFDARTPENSRLLDDVGAELGIRGERLPFHTVEQEMEMGRDELKRVDPGDRMAMSDLREFARSLNEPPN